MATSPRLSFQGYSFAVALAKNVDTIKGIIAIIGGINFGLAFSGGFDWKTLLVTLVAMIAGLAVKLLSDAVDFFFSEVDIPAPGKA